LALSASVARNGSLAIGSDPATILGLRRGLLIDNAARISDGAKGAEVLDHPLTSLDRRAENLRSRLDVFGKKNSPKNFWSLPRFCVAIADHLFRYFSRKRNAQVPPRTWLLSRPFGQRVNPTHQYGEVGEDAEPLGRAASVIAPTLRTGIGQRSNVQIDLNSLQLSDRN
jgi:hypothetical protein